MSHAFVDNNTLNILGAFHNVDAVFLLKILLPEQLTNYKVQVLRGRFPCGQDKALKCHAKVNLSEGRVRVDCFEDLDVWFEVDLVPRQGA